MPNPKTSLSASAAMTRRDALRLLGVGATGLFLTGCTGGSSLIAPQGASNNPGGPGVVVQGFQLPTNSSDPNLLRFTASNGETVSYYGTRDGTGKALSATSIIISAPGGGKTYYTLLPDGRPSTVVASDGTQFDFTWTSATVASVTVLSPDGKTQFNTSINLAQTMANSVHAAGTSVNLRQGKPASIHMAGRKIQTAVHSLATGDVNLNVISCGLPVTSAFTAVVDVTTPSGTFLAEYPAQFQGSGHFIASLPISAAAAVPAGQLQAVVNSIVSVLNAATSFLLPAGGTATIIQSTVATALAGSGLAPAAVAAINAATASVVSGINLYASTSGFVTAANAAALEKQLLAAPQLNQTFQANVLLVPKVFAVPTTFTGTPVPVDLTKTLPTLSADLGGKTSIRSLTLTPPNPGAGQSYVGTADVFCLPTNTVVTLSIVGTDGYTNSVSTTTTTSQQNGSFVLNVPGGAAGVHDTVTVTLAPPTGPTYTLTASLIFG